MHHFDRHTASDSPPISRSEISTTKDGPRPRARPQRGALRRAASQARRGYGRRVAQNGALWGGWGVGGGRFSSVRPREGISSAGCRAQKSVSGGPRHSRQLSQMRQPPPVEGGSLLEAVRLIRVRVGARVWVRGKGRGQGQGAGWGLGCGCGPRVRVRVRV